MIMSQEIRFCKALQILQKICSFVDDAHQEGKRIDEVEGGLFSGLLELGFSLLEEFVSLAGDGDEGETIQRDGELIRRLEQMHSRTYRSIFGILKIKRFVYGAREGQKIEYVPLDVQLGMPAGEQSYVLEDWLQRMVVKDPFQEAVDSLRDLLGITSSLRSAEVMSRKMADYVAPYRESQAPPSQDEEEEILVITVDGKGVPVRRPLEDRLREEAGINRPAWKSRVSYEKATKRRSRGDRKTRKQMAYVGAVYSIEPQVRAVDDILNEVHRRACQRDRPRPVNKRVWAEMTQIVDGEVLEGQPRIFSQLWRETIERDPERTKSLVCLMDGQRSLWALKETGFPRAVGILDLYHVLEWLWKAAYSFHPEGSADAQRFVERHLAMLLEGKVGYVIGVFRRFIVQRRLKGSKRKQLEKVIGYFDRNKQYMRYDEYLAAGYPIGSGVVEGACRHLVKDRMERTGMRWEAEGAQAVLSLRAVYLNREWRSFMTYRIETEQKTLYASSA